MKLNEKDIDVLSRLVAASVVAIVMVLTVGLAFAAVTYALRLAEAAPLPF